MTQVADQASPADATTPGPDSAFGADVSPSANTGADDADEAAVMTPSSTHRGIALSFTDKVEAFIARLSARNNFWQRLCSMIWLPYAFRSGIHMKQLDEKTFTAVLPFKRFNRNWYNAMAGASLLANSEIAGGMYIFGITGGDYTLVCKELTYKFLRPCFGPAVYRISPREDLRAMLAAQSEFNLTLDLDIYQQKLVPEALARIRRQDKLLARLASRERRVGRCTAIFHLTPSLHQKARRGHVRQVG